MTSDIGEMLNEVKNERHEKRASNRENSADYLAQRGIPFVSKNAGAHLIVEGSECFIDFWPGTGKWHSRNGDKGFGVRNLVMYIEKPSNELGHRPETAGGRHGSGGPTGSAPCGPERNSNMDEILKLREELERERMRLVACGVVALANTPDSAEKARTMHDDYRSASCDDVARAVDRQMALHNALTAVMSYPGVRDYLGGQVSEIADSALMGPNH